MPENNLHINTWDALLDGRQSSLEELYNQHYIGLLNYGIKLTHQRELTKDCIFQLFLTLWDSRHKLPHLTNVRSYLITCLHRELLAHIKKDRGRPVNAPAWEQLYPDKEFSYEDFLIQTQQTQELRKKVMIAFNELTTREKELLQLKFFENLDYDEIAHCCHITKRTAYNIIHTALKSLKRSLNGEKTSRRKSEYILLTTLKSILLC